MAYKLSKWYHNINDLPLSKFIEVVVNQNIFALIISGQPTQIDLLNAWEEICIGYEDAIGTNEHKLFNILFKEVAIIAADYEQVLVLINLLTILNDKGIYSGYFYSELNRLLKTSFVFSKDNKEENVRNLKRCYSRSKGIKLQLDLKQSQLNGIQSAHVDGKKITKEYYQAILITLSDHARYPVTDSITVFEYCERVKRFNHYYDQLKKQTHGRNK